VPIILALTLLKSGWQLAFIYAGLISLGAIVSASFGLNNGAAKFFPLHIVFYAPLWIAERCFSTYWAFYWFLTRGGYPFGDKVLSKGTGRAWNAETSVEKDVDQAS
jgi:hypothetical protein